MMEALCEISLYMSPVSTSVMLTAYSVIMPLCVSCGGAVQVSRNSVDLISEIVIFTGADDGAAYDIAVDQCNMNCMHNIHGSVYCDVYCEYRSS